MIFDDFIHTICSGYVSMTACWVKDIQHMKSPVSIIAASFGRLIVIWKMARKLEQVSSITDSWHFHDLV